MTDYQPPSAEVAAFVDRKKRECEEQRKRLADASVDDAWTIATDTSESVAARLQAILILVRRRDSRIPDLVLSLFDEADLSVWHSVIDSIHPDDPRIRERLRQFARQPDDAKPAAEALCVLALMKDADTVSICRDWFSRDQGLRNAAVEALRLLGNEPAVRLLNERWSDSTLTEEDRRTVALALTHFEHSNAVDYVTELAGDATDAWSVAAATALFLTNRTQGLKCMLHILDCGSLAAQQAMVSQISSLAGQLPHEYTADGIHEARLWVRTQTESES